MWIFLPNAFLSIVDKSNVKDCLVVRARRAEHIKSVFPDADIQHTPSNDYQYRADIPREQVAAVVAAQVAGIDYDNFKNEVKDKKLKRACSDVWGVCALIGDHAPYSGRRVGRDMLSEQPTVS